MVKISYGNMKMGKIPNSSLIPVKDCVNCKLCKKVCYAMKAYRLYPSVKKAWQHNSKIAHKDVWEWARQHIEWIRKNNPVFFRFFQAGDLLSESHNQAVVAICNACPDTKFMMFTKAFKYLKAPCPENLSVVLSIFPKMRIPERLRYLPRAYYYETGKEYGEPAYYNRFTKALECHGGCDNCGMCWHLRQLGRDVKFRKH